MQRGSRTSDLLGTSQDTGTVEAGKFADIVAVSGDPLADFADVELELVLWYTKLFSSNMVKISKTAKLPGMGLPSAVAEELIARVNGKR